MDGLMDAGFRPARSFFTLTKRELIRIARLSVQMIAAPFISNLLFLGIFGSLLKDRSAAPYSIPYLNFLIPGLIFSAVVLGSFQNPAFSLIMMKFQDTLKDYRQYPLKPAALHTVFALPGMVRGLAVGLATYAASGIFGGYAIQSPFYFWVSLACAAYIFSCLGIVVGLRFDTFEKTNMITSLLLTPLIYLGGVFLHTSALTGGIARWADWNPVAVMLNMVRGGYTGEWFLSPVIPTSITVVLSTGIIIISHVQIRRKKGLI